MKPEHGGPVRPRETPPGSRPEVWWPASSCPQALSSQVSTEVSKLPPLPSDVLQTFSLSLPPAPTASCFLSAPHRFFCPLEFWLHWPQASALPGAAQEEAMV